MKPGNAGSYKAMYAENDKLYSKLIAVAASDLALNESSIINPVKPVNLDDELK